MRNDNVSFEINVHILSQNLVRCYRSLFILFEKKVCNKKITPWKIKNRFSLIKYQIKRSNA